MSAAERQKALMISIHAPREGCDLSTGGFTLQTTKFQSTHPARGATGGRCTDATHSAYFNPRTPRGVRLAAGKLLSINNTFQSTHPARGATW